MPRDDDYGQVDGDGDVPFATSMRAQPWVKMGGLTPWHMWGNSQTFFQVPGAAESVPPLTGGQLVKVAYKRPESWHFLFHARVLRALRPNEHGAPATFDVIRVFFDVVTGHGRSQCFMPAFEAYQWQWGDGTALPQGQPMWSTQALGPPLRYELDVGPPILIVPTDRRPIHLIPGEDIQVNCRVEYEVNGFDAERPTIDIEVSGFFCPKSHVRPDWFQVDEPPAAQFSGEEIKGR